MATQILADQPINNSQAEGRAVDAHHITTCPQPSGFSDLLTALKCINLGIRFFDGPSFSLLSSCSSYARKTFEFSSFDIMVQTCKPNVKSVYINLRHDTFNQSYMNQDPRMITKCKQINSFRFLKKSKLVGSRLVIGCH